MVIISNTVYVDIICTKVLCTAFLLLDFGFSIRISTKKALLNEKGARKMLMKLTEDGFCMCLLQYVTFHQITMLRITKIISSKMQQIVPHILYK